MTSKRLIPCQTCGRLGDSERICERCGSKVWIRTPGSISRAWAFLLAGIVFYIPANVTPIIVTNSLGEASGSTVIGGVVALAEHGSIGIALIVFVASVAVPIAKFCVIVFLLVSIQRGWELSAHSRTELYHLTELIGRWSMIDVFVVAVLAALVQLGGLMTIEAGQAAAPFAAAVVCTMLSAQSIDTRMIWDTIRETDNE
ncbi:MAG: paraquat-inducible protein A [Myxococcota bacterium]